MKITLIKPTTYTNQEGLVKFKRAYMPSLTLPLLSALTPKDITIKIIDEQVSSINFNEKTDAVGISCLTLNARRGYDIASEFRKRGIPVIMGGHHVTALPDEALKYCDSVAMGEGEEIWPQIVDDLRIKNLKKTYKAGRLFDLKNSPIPDFSSLDLKKYLNPPLSRSPILPIQATRGCPFDCEFCSVTSFFGSNFRMRNINSVVNEIKTRGSAYYFFVDDNIIGNINYARELFQALIPLKIKWLGQFTMQLVNHPDLIKLAARSGCIGAYLGLESLSSDSLQTMNKRFNDVKRFAELFRLLNKAKIRPFASIIFGFDEEKADAFKITADFLIKNKAGKTYFYLLTPFPGTRLFNKLEKECRITTKDWNKFDCTHIVFKPKRLKPEQLEKGLWKAYKRFYSVHRILLRNLRYCSGNPIVYILVTFYDLKLRNSVARKIHPLCGGD